MHFLHRCRRCRAVLAQCRCPSQDKAVTFLDPPPGHVCDSEAVAYEEPAAKVEEALRSRVADLENEISLAMAALGDCTDGEDGRALNQRLTDATFGYEGTIRQLERRIADLEHENAWLRRGWAAHRFSIGDRVRSRNNSLGVITGIIWEVKWQDDGQEENCEETYLRKDDPPKPGWCHIGLIVKSKVAPGIQGVIVDWRGGGGSPDRWLVRWHGWPGWYREEDLTP